MHEPFELPPQFFLYSPTGQLSGHVKQLLQVSQSITYATPTTSRPQKNRCWLDSSSGQEGPTVQEAAFAQHGTRKNIREFASSDCPVDQNYWYAPVLQKSHEAPSQDGSSQDGLSQPLSSQAPSDKTREQNPVRVGPGSRGGGGKHNDSFAHGTHLRRKMDHCSHKSRRRNRIRHRHTCHLRHIGRTRSSLPLPTGHRRGSNHKHKTRRNYSHSLWLNA